MRQFVFFLCIGIARFLSASPFVWVVNYGDSSVAVIDAATDQLVTNISQSQGMFDGPFPFAFTPDGRFAYIVNYSAFPVTVSVIDTSDYHLVTVIDLGTASGPYAAAVSPNGKLLMVANYSSSTVSVVSTATNTLLATISTNIDGADGIAFSNDSSIAYVSDFSNDSIALIDAATLTASIPSGFNGTVTGAYTITVAPNGLYAYVAGTGQIFKLDLVNNSVSGTIPLPMSGDPLGIVFSSDGSTAYVVDTSNDAVDVINTADGSITHVIPTAQGMFSSAQYLTLADQKLYVTNESSSTVSVLSTATDGLVTVIMDGVSRRPYFILTQPQPGGQRAFKRPSNWRP